MKKMNKLTVAALALAAIAFASTSASAQTVTAGNNDLILGFEVGSGTGASSNLEVDLGSFNLYTTGQSFTLPQLTVSDLVATYGSGWASTVLWSVAGSYIDANGKAFEATSANTTAPKTNSDLSTPYSNITSMAPALNGQAQTANSTKSAVIGNSSTAASAIPGSYTSAFTASGASSGFGDTGISEAQGATTDELYQFSQLNEVGSGRNAAFPAATDLGTFTLSNAGVLSFTSKTAAVPEPSAYALGICAGLLFLVLRRRASVL